MIRIYCEAADAVLKETQTLTAGMINYPEVLLTFSNDWDGYGKAVIVRAGEVEESALIVNNKFTVPSECLAESGVSLIVGISGSDGVHTIPTIWCSCGVIMDSVDVDDSTSTGTATPSLVDQMLAYAQEIEAYAADMDTNVIRTAEVNDEDADNYGTASVMVSDSGAGENRTLTFTFANLKGNGIESIIFTTDGEDRGTLQIRRSDDTVTTYTGIKTALDTIASDAADIAAAELLRVTAEGLRVSAEEARVGAESARASAELDRAANETSRQNAESVRQNAETTRRSNEDTREVNENTRISNENTRISNENARRSAETSRASAESTRVSRENARVTAENARASAETVRRNQETQRVNNENERQQNETRRNNAENSRENAEYTRTSNEQERIAAESDRAAEFLGWGDVVSDAEAWAVGQRNGIDVTVYDETYQNNSKWYSELAENSAGNAAESEYNAAQSEAASAANAALAAAHVYDISVDGTTLVVTSAQHGFTITVSGTTVMFTSQT